MKLTQKTSRTNTTFVITGIVLVFAAVYIALELYGIANFMNLDGQTAEQSQETKTNADAKKDFIENNGSKEKSGFGSSSDTTATSPTSNPDNLKLTAQQEANGSVTVLTRLYGYSDGECTLELTKGERSASQSAQVIYQSEFSACAGFSISQSTLGAGTWNLKLTVTSKGLRATKTIALEVK